MIDFRIRAGKVQGEPGMSYCARKQPSAQRLMRSCQKDTGSHRTSFKGYSLAELETIWAKKKKEETKQKSPWIHDDMGRGGKQ